MLKKLFWAFLCVVSLCGAASADMSSDRFFKMLINNNIDNVKRAIAEDFFEVNKVYIYKGTETTPLLEAIRQGYPEIAEILLEAGADTALGTDMDDTPPLMYSVIFATFPVSSTFTQERQNNALRIADLLLKYQADVNYVNMWGWTALSMASSGIEYKSALALTEKILDAGAEINPVLKGDSWVPPLAWAIFGAWTEWDKEHENRAKLIKIMLDAGANPNATMGIKKITPLHIAADFDYEVSKLLIDAGANAKARDKDGRTPLHLALARWDIPTMKLLMK